MDERWLTVRDVAEYIQLSPDLIYRLARQGQMPATKVRGRWRFKKDKIDEGMEEQRITTSYTTGADQKMQRSDKRDAAKSNRRRPRR